MAIKHGVIVAAAAGLTCSFAMAQEQARVLSAIPVVQQVGVPQQFCQDEQVYAGQRTSGAGTVIGAVIGGVAGNAMGRGGYYGPRGRYYGSNRGPSTVVGALAGGLIGHAIDSSTGQPHYQTMRRCTQETVYENRTVGYDVTYEYAGRRYTTRMDQHPGDWVPVQIQPQNSFSTAPAATQFVGPSGVYRSAPANVTITESYTYHAAPAVVPIVVTPGYPMHPGYGHRPAPHYWR